MATLNPFQEAMAPAQEIFPTLRYGDTDPALLADAQLALAAAYEALEVAQTFPGELQEERAMMMITKLEAYIEAFPVPPPQPPPPPPPPPPPDELGRIVISSDGNEHDLDDIGSSAMSMALIAATGRQDDLELYIYNDHIWGSDPEQKAEMTESVTEAAERFDFDETELMSAVDDPLGASQAIADQINASSASDPLTILMAGPAHVVAKGVEMSDPAKREYVTVVSHSGWNDNHPAEHGSPYTWESMEDSGVNLDHIPNQNELLSTPDEEPWNWLENSTDPNLAWVYGQDQKGGFDVSDSGMTYYALTGDAQGTPADYREFLT